MAEWWVRFIDRYDDNESVRGEYALMHPTVEIRNSEPGGFEGELALTSKWRGSTTLGISRDEFAPYRSYYQLYRVDTAHCISEGMITSVNLNFNRDTILISGKDWLHYLQRRIYPFSPEDYIDEGNPDWVRWPRQWPDVAGTHGPAVPSTGSPPQGNPVDVGLIVRQLIQSMRFESPTQEPPISYTWPGPGDAAIPGTPGITTNIPNTGQTTKYKIYPADQTTIFEHITKLSEQTDKGFEFDIIPISREFKMWVPRRAAASGLFLPIYQFVPVWEGVPDQITAWDWTNEGPEGTYLVGVGTSKNKVGATWTTEANVATHGRLDKVYDFGEIQYPELIQQMLKDQMDLHPQKKLALQVINPEFLVPNFYTGGRPRAVIGAVVRCRFDFIPYHLVDADFLVNAIKWSIDDSTNETVELELEMIYDSAQLVIEAG